MASGNERIILTGSRGGPISLSPDGHWIARYNPSTNGSLQSLVILSVETGRSRELLRLSDGEFDSNPMSWTPDSRAVLLRKWGRRAGYELQLVPINGETPRKLDIDLKGARPGEALGKIRLSPDGKHLAYVAGKPIYRSETWVLENFLPPAAGK
jgi:Tol biopolymer transport system component